MNDDVPAAPSDRNTAAFCRRSAFTARRSIGHKNAIRVERAGLVHSFHNESEPWEETDLTVVGPEFVRP
jgi:hypothetical protein